MIFTDYKTSEGKQWSKPLLRKDGHAGVIDSFLGKEIHDMGLRVEVRWVKGAWEEVTQAGKRSIWAPSVLIRLWHRAWRKEEQEMRLET